MFGRSALGFSAAGAILAGCGALRPAQDDMPIGAPGAVAQTAPMAKRAADERPWMLPAAKSEDLLYVATGDNVYALSYPAGKLTGALNIAAVNLCANQNGDVFVLQFGGNKIVEYPHGSYVPIATLNDMDEPLGCAVDPTTGNLAVTNEASGAGEVGIFPNAQEPAQYYRDPEIANYGLCGYDAQGNLFLDGTGSVGVLAELPKGGSTFANFTLKQDLDPFGSVQWDGTHMTLSDPPAHAIYRVRASGSSLEIVGTTHVHRWHTSSNEWPYTQTWLEGERFIGQVSVLARIGVWTYPAGRNPRLVSRVFKAGSVNISGLAVSLAAH